ncbi:MAG: hypothetical protein JEZ14_05645, partial [Marinilabiliaceae bacterium]|nr:hypothetical protein [Marinilabiliaceae bacterium]
MKKLVFFFLAALTIVACKKDDKVGPGQLEVSLQLPEEYKDYDITTIEVVMENVVSTET